MTNLHFFDAGRFRFFVYNVCSDNLRAISQQEFSRGVKVHGEWTLQGLKKR